MADWRCHEYGLSSHGSGCLTVFLLPMLQQAAHFHAQLRTERPNLDFCELLKGNFPTILVSASPEVWLSFSLLLTKENKDGKFVLVSEVAVNICWEWQSRLHIGIPAILDRSQVFLRRRVCQFRSVSFDHTRMPFLDGLFERLCNEALTYSRNVTATGAIDIFAVPDRRRCSICWFGRDLHTTTSSPGVPCSRG